MTKDKKPERGPKPTPSREDRLKAALKANLTKRKAQSRARAANNTGKDTAEE
ncbi:MAG: hypothetical protein HRU31_14060 [Rhodobacteraceae bacterium]|nr:hypothetical protein [Paracoccaceae bacterium]